MINLTGEMLQVAHRAIAPDQVMPPGLVRALQDVLDLVERENVVTPRPSAIAGRLEDGTAA